MSPEGELTCCVPGWRCLWLHASCRSGPCWPRSWPQGPQPDADGIQTAAIKCLASRAKYAQQSPMIRNDLHVAAAQETIVSTLQGVWLLPTYSYGELSKLVVRYFVDLLNGCKRNGCRAHAAHTAVVPPGVCFYDAVLRQGQHRVHRGGPGCKLHIMPAVAVAIAAYIK